MCCNTTYYFKRRLPGSIYRDRKENGKLSPYIGREERIFFLYLTTFHIERDTFGLPLTLFFNRHNFSGGDIIFSQMYFNIIMCFFLIGKL